MSHCSDIKKFYKVCILFPFKLFPVAGTSVRALNFARALVKYGNEVCIVEFVSGVKASRQTKTYDGFVIRTVVHAHSKLRTIPPIYMMILVIHFLREIRRLLREKQFDIFHCTALEMAFIGVLVRKLFGRLVVGDLHSCKSIEAKGKYIKRFMSVAEKFVCRHVNAVIVPTRELKDLYCLWGINPSKIHVAENVLDTVRFRPRKDRKEIREKLGLAATDRVIVFHGNLKNDYNIQSLKNLYKISRIVRGKIDHVKFLVVGPYRKKPAETHTFVYTGYVDDLPSYLNIADFAVVPIFFGSLGIRSRLFEYFACKVPVITTPDGVTGMRFAQEQNVVIVRDNIEDIAEIAVELMGDPISLRKMKANCRSVIGEFDLRSGAKNLISIYANVTKKARA